MPSRFVEVPPPMEAQIGASLGRIARVGAELRDNVSCAVGNEEMQQRAGGALLYAVRPGSPCCWLALVVVGLWLLLRWSLAREARRIVHDQGVDSAVVAEPSRAAAAT